MKTNAVAILGFLLFTTCHNDKTTIKEYPQAAETEKELETKLDTSQIRDLDSLKIMQISIEIDSRLINSRYMESKCIDFEYVGWENYPIKKCQYYVTDHDGTIKKAEVIMLNPSSVKLATWIYTTCLQVKGTVNDSDLYKLVNHVINQSGGQFPIAGIVYEDIIPKDGIYEIYCFRNGVTVLIDGVKHRDVTEPNEEEISKSIYGEVTKVMKYARIQSTTPNQYKLNGGYEDVGTDQIRTKKWLEVVKVLYQDAWDSAENELMIAWAKANL